MGVGDHRDDETGPRDASTLSSAPTLLAGAPVPRDDDGPLAPGTQIDHYTVERLLGRGGMGAVYLAVDRQLDRRVAIKVVNAELLATDKARASFLFEARTTARFNHPHIVTVYGAGEHEGAPYVAFEYIDGTTLEDRLQLGLGLEDGLTTMLAVAEALIEAHDRGVLHRDLKPGNVLISADGRARVVDFGLAKPVDADDLPIADAASNKPRNFTWAGAGTPAYMAPEQWCMMPASRESDVWALGVMIFEICEGRLPFDGDTALALGTVVCAEDPAPRLARADVPPALAELVAACLEKDDTLRPSARAVAETLREVLQLGSATSGGRLVTVRPEELPSEQTTTQRRSVSITSEGRQVHAIARTRASTGTRRALAWLVAALALASVGAWVLVRATRERDPAPPATETTSQADALFESTLELWRRGMMGTTAFEKVLLLEPDHPRTHLFLAMRRSQSAPSDARRHLREAQNGWARLPEPERGMVDVLRLSLADPPDPRRIRQAAADLASAHPGDSYVQYFCARMAAEIAGGDPTEPLAAFRRVVAIDPAFVPALARVGEHAAYAGKLDDAEKTLDACIADNPDADECMLIRSLLDERAGRCERVAGASRQRIAAYPDDAAAYGSLGRALAGLEQFDAAEQALHQAWARLDDETRRFQEPLERAFLATLRGNLADAERALLELLDALRTDNDEWRHTQVAVLLLQIYEETDRIAEAGQLAVDLGGRRAALSVDARTDDFALIKDPTPHLIAARRAAATIDDAEANELLASWAAARLESAGPALTGYVWLHGIAATARHRAHAEWALARLPASLPAFAPRLPIDLPVGNVYFLAGDHARARPALEAAVRDCRVLDHPIEHMRALGQLAQTYELAGEPTLACSMYSRLHGMWKHAPARTAASAASALERMGCK